ncbi:MAG TPA: dihydrolipoamide acetyltransferase family protein [Gemmatimonadales bacterium]|nr:dihydrolipoamide acetyltransferase family protein [Gemmatimonadales bacterium]
MPTKVVMEALSPTMEEGRLVEWKKQAGEPVAVGDVLAEVETDKAVMELVARVGGVLLRHTVEAGATVPVSAEVAVIGEPGEAVSAAKQPAAAPKAAEEQATQPAPGRNQPVSMPPAPSPDADGASAATPVSGAAAAPPAPSPPGTPADRLRASPLARRIAAERGIDLAAVQGSGPEGRVIARDLEAAPVRTPAGPTVAEPARQPPAPLPSSGFTDVPLTQIRKTIAQRLAQSIGPIPTFYLTTEVDMERTAELRTALPEDGRPSFNDIIIKTTAMALRQHPMVNAWWQDDRIRQWHDIHVSMAVAIDDGLITPVIRHADQKSLRAISAEAKDLASRARERKLAPDEYTGGTFSVSNLGMLDIDEFTAVINPPEAAILAVGRIVAKPVDHEGQVQVRRRLRVTLSCDHRIVDGATGAMFLKTLKQMLENPLALVW